MELGDGDPEGWPRKGGEVFSNGEKDQLSTPHLAPHPVEPGVRATLTHVHPSLRLLCSTSQPTPLCLLPSSETAIVILQCAQRKDIYKAIPHALSPLVLLTGL